jgi:hypothetical protein
MPFFERLCPAMTTVGFVALETVLLSFALVP